MKKQMIQVGLASWFCLLFYGNGSATNRLADFQKGVQERGEGASLETSSSGSIDHVVKHSLARHFGLNPRFYFYKNGCNRNEIIRSTFSIAKELHNPDVKKRQEIVRFLAVLKKKLKGQKTETDRLVQLKARAQEQLGLILKVLGCSSEQNAKAQAANRKEQKLSKNCKKKRKKHLENIKKSLNEISLLFDSVEGIKNQFVLQIKEIQDFFAVVNAQKRCVSTCLDLCETWLNGVQSVEQDQEKLESMSNELERVDFTSLQSLLSSYESDLHLRDENFGLPDNIVQPIKSELKRIAEEVLKTENHYQGVKDMEEELKVNSQDINWDRRVIDGFWLNNGTPAPLDGSDNRVFQEQASILLGVTVKGKSRIFSTLFPLGEEPSIPSGQPSEPQE